MKVNITDILHIPHIRSSESKPCRWVRLFEGKYVGNLGNVQNVRSSVELSSNSNCTYN